MQISTAYGQQKEGGIVLPRNKYTEIRAEKPKDKDEAKRPEFKSCKFTSEAIVTDGSEIGTLRKVCTNPACPVHHPKPQSNRDDERWKAEQDKRRKEEAIAAATGIRVLGAIATAVPVRLLKRDLLFVLTQLVPLLDEWGLQTLARQHGIKKSKDTEDLDKLFLAYLRRAEEGILSRVLVEAAILLASSRSNTATALREAATAYKVDVDAIAQKLKQEFAAKAKAKKEVKPAAKAKKAA